MIAGTELDRLDAERRGAGQQRLEWPLTVGHGEDAEPHRTPRLDALRRFCDRRKLRPRREQNFVRDHDCLMLMGTRGDGKIEAARVDSRPLVFEHVATLRFGR